MKTRIAYILLFLATLLLVLLDLSVGSTFVPFKTVLSILLSSKDAVGDESVLLLFRLPRTLMAIIVGSGLAVSGLLMQTLFRNPLAGPYVLGISSGASVGVAIVAMASALFPGVLALYFGSVWGIAIASFLGAMLVMFLVLLASVKISDSVSLLIVGIMFGSLATALVSILQYFSDPSQIKFFLLWTFGSLSGVSLSELKVLIIPYLAGIAVSFYAMKGLNALLMGENYARNVGINVRQIRWLLILSTSLLTGTLTAFTGPIGFIGVAVPHIARYLFRTSDHKTLMPATFLIGISLMLACDIISQMPGSQSTLPLNAVTSLFGAPIVILVIFRSRNLKQF